MVNIICVCTLIGLLWTVVMSHEVIYYATYDLSNTSDVFSFTTKHRCAHAALGFNFEAVAIESGGVCKPISKSDNSSATVNSEVMNKTSDTALFTDQFKVSMDNHYLMGLPSYCSIDCVIKLEIEQPQPWQTFVVDIVGTDDPSNMYEVSTIFAVHLQIEGANDKLTVARRTGGGYQDVTTMPWLQPEGSRLSVTLVVKETEFLIGVDQQGGVKLWYNYPNTLGIDAVKGLMLRDTYISGWEYGLISVSVSKNGPFM